MKLAALTLAVPASAQTVVDGDTIRIGAATFHLWGIDAPDAKQTCSDGWQAGTAASRPVEGSDKRRFYAVLHLGGIRSPLDRAAIVAERRQ
jgi:hypothetical protein